MAGAAVVAASKVVPRALPNSDATLQSNASGRGRWSCPPDSHRSNPPRTLCEPRSRPTAPPPPRASLRRHALYIAPMATKADQVISVAESQVGVSESPMGSNRGDCEKYQRAYG